MEIDLEGWAFKGDLDDFQIFNGVLTPQQVKALCLYNNWKPDTSNDTIPVVVTGLNHTIEGKVGNMVDLKTLSKDYVRPVKLSWIRRSFWGGSGTQHSKHYFLAYVAGILIDIWSEPGTRF